jgi:hypothetical protein
MTSSVGMMTFPIYGKIQAMFQTTNQAIIEISTSQSPSLTCLVWPVFFVVAHMEYTKNPNHQAALVYNRQ